MNHHRFPLLRALAALFLALALAACGGSDDPAPPLPPAEGSATIGAAGGIVDGPDGTQLVVPPGALSSDVLIRIARSRAGAPDLPAGALPNVPVYELTPHGLLFGQPVQLKIPANPQGGTSESAWAAEPGGPWSSVAARVENGFLVVDRVSLSWFTYPVPGYGDAFVRAADSARPFQSDPASALRYERVEQPGPPAVVWTRMVLSETATLRLPLKFTALPGCTAGQLEVESWFQPHLLPTLPRQVVLQQPIVLVAPAAGSPEEARGVWVGQHTFVTNVNSSSKGRQFYYFKFSCLYGSQVRGFSTAHTDPIHVEPVVPVAPTFTLSPVATQGVAGQPATFTAIAQGTPTPSISWQVAPAAGAFVDVVGEPDCAPTAAPPSGAATNASCRLANPPLGSSGQRYRAIAVNAAAPGGVASSEAVLTISAALVSPTITNQPANQIATVGGSATFSVTATGTATLAYTWQLSGTNLPSVSGGFSAGTCSGTVTYSNGNATITLSGLSAGCNGVPVSVTVSNGVNPNAVSNSRTLTVNPVTQVLSLLAGDIGGSGSLDGTGADARIGAGADNSIAFDAAGNAYFSETISGRVRKVTPAGVVTTIAGASTPVQNPSGVAVDRAGNVFVVERGGVNRILRITPAGVLSAWTPQGSLSVPMHLAIDASDNLYVTSETLSGGGLIGGLISRVSPAQVISPFYAFGSGEFVGKIAVANDGSVLGVGGGTLYGTVVRITSAGALNVLAGARGEQGNVDASGSAARFFAIGGLTIGLGGDLFVTDNRAVRRITLAGAVTTVSGAATAPFGQFDGAGTTARYEGPGAIAAGPGGDMLIVDAATLRKLTPSPNYFASTLAGKQLQVGTTDGIGAAARFNCLCDVALDAAGNAYLASGGGIRKVAPDGTVTTIPVTPSFYYYIAFDASRGELVAASPFAVWRITTAGVATLLAGDPAGQAYLDATGGAARFVQIGGLAVDAAGNVFVSEILTYTIRRITPAGVVTTYAGAPDQPGTADGAAADARFLGARGLAVDGSGNLFVASNLTIRRITPAGQVSTVAGTPNVAGSVDGTGAAAQFRAPGKLAFQPSGNLLISDGSTLRRMTPANVVTTVLGVDGERAVRLGASPRLNSVGGMAVRPDGRIVLMSEGAVLEATIP